MKNNTPPTFRQKPLGRKAYGSIPHLPGSRLGPAEHVISPGQLRIATQQRRDRHDWVWITEKLDGSNVAVAKYRNQIVPLVRSGYLAVSSPHEQHRLFHDWVFRQHQRFDSLLDEGERVCGEWLAQAHGTRYDLSGQPFPFVPFDIMRDAERISFTDMRRRVRTHDFIPPKLLNAGEPMTIDQVVDAIQLSGHGALDPVEGAVWRVERHVPGQPPVVDFLAKYVRSDKVDGCYLPSQSGSDPVWNWRPTGSVNNKEG